MLRRLLKEDPRGIDPVRALEIIAEAAEGLHYAHERGILHRDIKPENILIEEETGQVKVADFGLASFFEKPEASILDGAICGSPSYMSPEQAKGEALSPRSDVFSLGVTLYQLLSGRRPFEGRSTLEVLENIRNNQRVPLRSRDSNLPIAVLHLVDKATAHHAEERFR